MIIQPLNENANATKYYEITHIFCRFISSFLIKDQSGLIRIFIGVFLYVFHPSLSHHNCRFNGTIQHIVRGWVVFVDSESHYMRSYASSEHIRKLLQYFLDTPVVQLK